MKKFSKYIFVTIFLSIVGSSAFSMMSNDHYKEKFNFDNTPLRICIGENFRGSLPFAEDNFELNKLKTKLNNARKGENLENFITQLTVDELLFLILSGENVEVCNKITHFIKVSKKPYINYKKPKKERYR